jgi:hypothetical protein
MRLRAWAAIGLLALTVAVTWAILSWERARQREEPSRSVAESEQAQPKVSVASLREPRREPGEVDPKPGIRLATLLMPEAGVSAVEDTVRVGLARVSEEARARHLLWIQSGAEGAGPNDMGELAEVQRWVELPALRLPDGRVQVGPADIPEAQFYLLEARGSDGLRFYRSRFSGVDIPSEIAPITAAGLRLRTDVDDPRLRLQLLRRAEAPPTGQWHALLVAESPHLLALFDEAGLEVGTDVELMPLAPTSIDAVAWLGQVVIQRSTLHLAPGKITELALDRVRIQDAKRRAIDLEIDVLDATSGQPVADVSVTFPGPQGETLHRTDSAGRVRWSGLPAGHQAWLSLEFPEVAQGGLPRWPSRKLVPVVLPMAEDAPADRTHRETVEVSPLSWLVLSGEGRRSGPPIRGQPYPVYGLQRDREGEWEDLGSDHFVPIPEGLAVSIGEPGKYRVFKAESPWGVAFSQALVFDIHQAQTRRSASLDHPVRRDISVRLVDAFQQPLISTPVMVSARLSGLPAVEITTDKAGLLHLAAATDQSVVVSARAGERGIGLFDSHGKTLGIAGADDE